ncbi:hypothetical protein [Actinomadura meridiana]|uniref:hypothetical protein n=1 Tax=Actinomadura meridiana TaxID=559626 RepID=UPI0031EC9E8F
MTFTVDAGHDTDPMVAVTGPDPRGDAVPEPLADGLGEVVAEALGSESDDTALIRAGIAISAPITKNTAAMTTLGNCIAVLPGPPADADGWPMILDHS